MKFWHGSKFHKVSFTLLFECEIFFLVEFRANTGGIQRLGKFGAKISGSVKQKCQANLNHAGKSLGILINMLDLSFYHAQNSTDVTTAVFMDPDEIKTKLKLKQLSYFQLHQGADDLLEDGALFWTERLLLRLVWLLAGIRMQQVGDLGIVDEVRAEDQAKDAHLEAMAEAALGGHELSEWERVENGWKAKCGRCGQTTWVGNNGVRYSLLQTSCEDGVEDDR